LIHGLVDFLSSLPIPEVVTVRLFLLAAATAVSTGLPVLPGNKTDIPVKRALIITMFAMSSGVTPVVFSVAATTAGAVLRHIIHGTDIRRCILSTYALILGFAVGTLTLETFLPDIPRYMTVLLSVPPAFLLEFATTTIPEEGSSGPLKTLLVLSMLYAVSLVLSAATITMTDHSGTWGLSCALLGLLGTSVIGLSIGSRYERDSYRIREIGEQNRLTVRLLDSQSFGDFLSGLCEYICPDGNGEVAALTGTESDEDRILWKRNGFGKIRSDLVRGKPPGRGELSSDFIVSGEKGTAFGLEEGGKLLLFTTGSAETYIRNLPPSLLENLATLLSHAWQAVGYSISSRRSFLAAAVMLARFADAKDDYTHGHSLRVANISCTMGSELGLSSDRLQTLKVAALLHDIGKLAVPVSILNKKGLLTRRERKIVESHPEEGAGIVSGLPGYREVAEIILGHHEKLDGTGYPRKLSGNDIPFLAKIVAVADTFDAITSDRAYHSISNKLEAMEIIKEGSGRIYDARVVAVLEKAVVGESGRRS